MPKFLITISFLVLSAFCFAQKHNDYFLKNNGEQVDNIDSADFIRIVSEPDSSSKLFNVLELFKSKKRKLIGKSSRIDPPSYEGQVITYFENGHKESISNYVNGLISGLQYQYYPNGKLYIVNEFPVRGKRKMEIPYTPLVMECYDSIGTKLISEGNGYFIGYDEEFKNIEWKGKITNGERDSTWTGSNLIAKVSFIENYNNGKLLNGYETDLQEGVSVSYTNPMEIPPQCRGGIRTFYKYIYENLKYPKTAIENKTFGKLLITFIVERDGSITNAVVLRGVGDGIDEEGLRIIKNSPKWFPGFQNGHAVRTSFTIPIDFSFK